MAILILINKVKKFFIYFSILAVSIATFAQVSADDYRSAQINLHKYCANENASKIGSPAAKECAAAGRRLQDLDNKFNQELSQLVIKREMEKIRIQQDEIWREQVRRSRNANNLNGY